MITKQKMMGILLLAVSLTVSAQNKVPQLGKAPISKVIKAMTLEEKAQLLVGGWRIIGDYGKTFKERENPNGAVGATVPIARIGIPGTLVTDGPAGCRLPAERKGDSKKYYCTGFPIGSMLASTWNTDLVNRIGKAMGNETLEYGCDVLLGPALNIHRNPLCGRNFEYYSEDPVLAGKIAASAIKGIQSQGVGTSPKHFVANNQETLRTLNDARISQRALREIYLKGFEIAIKEGQPWTIMASYNKLNGLFTQAHYGLLTSLLRDEWGYKGIVMTDWTNPRDSKQQVHAGSDLLMYGMPIQVQQILDAVHSGQLSMQDVDRNVKNMLEYVEKTPSFRQISRANAPDLNAHSKIVRQSAAEGIVLLKNDNTLPFSKKVNEIALLGQGSHNFLAVGWGSGTVYMKYIINMEQGLLNAGYHILPAINDIYKKVDGEPEMKKDALKQWAGESDIAVITISRNSGEGSDRQNIPGDYELTGTEKNLIANTSRAFHAVGKKVVVVLNISGVVETASWKNDPDAILLVWEPGQEGGNAVADVLGGKINPSGKLPMTFALNYMDIPSSKNFPYIDRHIKDDWGTAEDRATKNYGYTDYEEGIWIGYRYFNTNKKPVSYPFGYGLSYTTFGYSAPTISKSGDVYKATVTVKNTGNVSGKEVVELYIAAPKGTMDKPSSELKAFAKTKLLQPSQSEKVVLQFNMSDLASFDEKTNSWVLDCGKYEVLFGASSIDILQKTSFYVKKGFAKRVKTVL